MEEPLPANVAPQSVSGDPPGSTPPEPVHVEAATASRKGKNTRQTVATATPGMPPYHVILPSLIVISRNGG